MLELQGGLESVKVSVQFFQFLSVSRKSFCVYMHLACSISCQMEIPE